jgi:hypothetical protein
VWFAYEIDYLSSLIPSPHVHITKAISSITKGSQVSMGITLWFSLLEGEIGRKLGNRLVLTLSVSACFLSFISTFSQIQWATLDPRSLDVGGATSVYASRWSEQARDGALVDFIPHVRFGGWLAFCCCGKSAMPYLTLVIFALLPTYTVTWL